MTPREIVEALVDATLDAYDKYPQEDAEAAAARTRRDAIRDRLVAFVDAIRAEWLIPCNIPCQRKGGCDSPSCKAWRELEEACREPK